MVRTTARSSELNQAPAQDMIGRALLNPPSKGVLQRTSLKTKPNVVSS